MPSSLSHYLVSVFAFSAAAGTAHAFSQGMTRATQHCRSSSALHVASRHHGHDTKQQTRRNRNRYASITNNGRKQHSRNGFQKGYSRYETVQFNKWLHRLTDPQQAEDALLERIESGSRDFDTVSFNLVMTAWAREGNAIRAHAIFRHLKHLSKTYPHLRLDAFSFAAILNAYAKCGGGREAALRAHSLLQEMLVTLPLIQTDVCHNAVLNTWSVSGEPDAGIQAQALLDSMVEARLATRISYNACLKAWARSHNPHKAESLLRTMPTRDKISYTTVIDAWAKAGNVDRAEALLREMEELSKKPNSPVVPDIIAYTSVLGAYSQQKHDMHKASQLFERMQRYCPEATTSALTYNTLIHWIDKGNGDSMQAEAILRLMIKKNVKPCVITYTAVISCHANHGRAYEAEALLEEMLDYYERTGDVDYLPNVKTFASVLHAWAKSNAPEALDRAHLLLQKMDKVHIKPNTIVFGQIFSILSNSRDVRAAERAESLLEKMEILAIENRDMRPDATTFAYLINTYTKSGIETAADRAAQILTEVEERYERGEKNLKPTSLLYSAVLQAFAKNASPEGAERAEQLLQRNKRWYREGKEYARPTTLCYNAVMDAHARSGMPRAAERAQQLLDEMEAEAGLTPTTRSFNAAILAWKNSKIPDTVQAEALLKRMNERYKEGDVGCKPDSVTINSIIGVWAKSRKPNAGKRAEAFLDFMDRAYEAGDATLKPDRYSFNSVMDAYAQTGDGRRAQKLFQRMMNLFVTTGDQDLKPDRITFTALKNAWTKSTDGDAPEQLGRVVELMQQHVGVE